MSVMSVPLEATAPLIGLLNIASDSPSDLRSASLIRSSDLRLLRNELFNKGIHGASSEDVLYLILCHAVTEIDARDLARRLLRKFGELGAILLAKDDHILNVCQGDRECVALLKSAHLLMKRVLFESIENRPLLGGVRAIFEYLQISLAHEANEVFRVLYLNSKNYLIRDEQIAQGTINRVQVYPREVIKSVLEYDAQAVILVHNHPSGSTKPSTDDITMTQHLQRALSDIGVVLHDHIIVTRNNCVSMHSLHLI